MILLPFAGSQIPHCSATGLWDRFAKRDSLDAYYRAYQWSVPTIVRLTESTYGQLPAFFARCRAWPRTDPIDQPDFLFFAQNQLLFDRFTDEFLEEISSSWPRSVYCIDIGLLDQPLALTTLETKTIWAWYCSISAWYEKQHQISEWCISHPPTCILFAATNTETRIAHRKLLDPSHELEFARQCLENKIEVWRCSDFLEAEASQLRY